MPPLNYTATELATLAPEERAALEAESGDNADVLQQLAEGGEGEAAAAAAKEGESTAAAAAEGATTPPAEGAAAAPDAAAQAAAAAAQPTEPAAQQNPVVYRANVGDLAKDIATQKDAIKAARGEKRAALVKLNDGEIDADEYARIEDEADAKIDAANDRVLELNRAATRVEVSVELTQQQQSSSWKSMLNGYVAKAKSDLGIDYGADEGKRGEFNSLLKAFAQEASDKGMTDDNGMAASQWALDQAASIMALRYPKAQAKPAAGAPAAQGQQPAAAAAPAQQPAAAAARAGIPPSLGGMPAAAAAPVGDDVMAKIGTLEGEELERYIAALPKDQAARLFASAQ